MSERTVRRVRAEARAREQAEMLGFGRLHLFVPALMSVGLVFWIVSEITEVVRSRAEESRSRRAARMAVAVADEVVGRPTAVAPGLRARAAYLLVGSVLVSASVYLVVGSAGNYLRRGGYVRDIAWLLALAVAVAAVALVFGVTALVLFFRYPSPPPWAWGLALRSPLASPVDDETAGHRPPWYLTGAVVAVTAALAGVAALVAWSPKIVESFNVEVTAWFTEHHPLGSINLLDSYGIGLWFGAAALVVIVVAGLRCTVLLLSSLGAVAAAVLAGVSLRPLVAQLALQERTVVVAPRTFPSVPAALTVVLVGCLVLALVALTRRPWIAWPLRIAGLVLVVASAAHHLASDEIPTDVIGGLLLGAVLLLVVQWSLAHERWHRSCRSCQWVVERPTGPLHGAIPLHAGLHAGVRCAARLSAAIATIAFAFVSLRIHLPEGTPGYALDASTERLVQLALTLVMSVGVLLAWRWEAVGAALMALAAAGVGIFAAIEYRPGVALVLTMVLMIPAVLTWLSWQHRRRAGPIIALAVVTAVLIGTTWVGASQVHDSLFGPTHPSSSAAAVAVDRVEWLWTGALSSESVTVTARVEKGSSSARLVAQPATGGEEIVAEGTGPDEDRMVRFEVEGLQPATEYGYRIEVDGHEDEGRGSGSFSTPVDGPMSFTVAAASCAMTGSNGAVFDAIAAEDPLMDIILGDFGYSNITSTDPTAFIDAYGTQLSTPGQSALSRQVPFAYLWDDHDYDGNDADASAPSRPAASDAYRRAVPHYDVPPGVGPISQAFTIGRVRFIITDERSQRTADTMLGEAQLQWFLDELRTSSPSHAAVVWVNSVPWIGPPAEGADGWAGYGAERARISEAIARAGIHNLVMVAGDAHMVAIDDGTNTDYSSTGGAGFPLLQAAALDRPGDVKGGPYSEGAYPGGGQYGLISVVDEGGPTIMITLSGRTWDGETLVSYTVEMGPGIAGP